MAKSLVVVVIAVGVNDESFFIQILCEQALGKRRGRVLGETASGRVELFPPGWPASFVFRSRLILILYSFH